MESNTSEPELSRISQLLNASVEGATRTRGLMNRVFQRLALDCQLADDRSEDGWYWLY